MYIYILYVYYTYTWLGCVFCWVLIAILMHIKPWGMNRFYQAISLLMSNMAGMSQVGCEFHGRSPVFLFQSGSIHVGIPSSKTWVNLKKVDICGNIPPKFWKMMVGACWMVRFATVWWISDQHGPLWPGVASTSLRVRWVGDNTSSWHWICGWTMGDWPLNYGHVAQISPPQGVQKYGTPEMVLSAISINFPLKNRLQ